MVLPLVSKGQRVKDDDAKSSQDKNPIYQVKTTVYNPNDCKDRRFESIKSIKEESNRRREEANLVLEVQRIGKIINFQVLRGTATRFPTIFQVNVGDEYSSRSEELNRLQQPPTAAESEAR